MKKAKYIRPSLRYVYIQGDVLLVSSCHQVSVSHEEGVWEADANKESNFSSIWDSEENSMWK